MAKGNSCCLPSLCSPKANPAGHLPCLHRSDSFPRSQPWWEPQISEAGPLKLHAGLSIPVPTCLCRVLSRSRAPHRPRWPLVQSWSGAVGRWAWSKLALGRKQQFSLWRLQAQDDGQGLPMLQVALNGLRISLALDLRERVRPLGRVAIPSFPW